MKMTTDSLQYSNVNYLFSKPNACPYCGVTINSESKILHSGDGVVLILFTCSCKECRKKHYATYARPATTTREVELEFNATYPLPQMDGMPETLLGYSEAFAQKCREAFASEVNGFYELAACGYRNAIEALIKDYIVDYCGCTLSGAKLRRLTIDKCIKEYLHDIDATVSVYFAKEAGNRATHYPELPGQEFDFSEFKSYFSLFIATFDHKLKIQQLAGGLPPQHQPVSLPLVPAGDQRSADGQ